MNKKTTNYLCGSLFMGTFGILFLSISLKLKNRIENYDDDCKNLLSWSFGLSIWFLSFAFYLLVISFSLSIFDKFILSRIFTLKELLGLLFAFASLIICIGVSANFSDDCYLVSLLNKCFIYVYWGTISCGYFIVCSVI